MISCSYARLQTAMISHVRTSWYILCTYISRTQDEVSVIGNPFRCNFDTLADSPTGILSARRQVSLPQSVSSNETTDAGEILTPLPWREISVDSTWLKKSSVVFSSFSLSGSRASRLDRSDELTSGLSLTSNVTGRPYHPGQPSYPY